MKKVRLAAAVAAAAASAVALVGCGSSTPQSNAAGAEETPTAAHRQQVTIETRAHSFAVRGLDGLHAGLVDFTVRDTSSLAHGAGLIRLSHGVTAAQATKIVGGDTIPSKLPFALYGGVPELEPGGSWHATMPLQPGRYVLFDDGRNGKGMQRQFTVGAATDTAAAPPPAVGTIVMRDFAFGIHLPASWNGNGVIRIPNVGKQIHELTFVRFDSSTLERKFAAILSKGYPQGPPPAGAHIVYALGGSSPGRTSYVRVHLTPGRYLAICLFPDPDTGKPHTALGMLSHVVVK